MVFHTDDIIEKYENKKRNNIIMKGLKLDTTEQDIVKEKITNFYGEIGSCNKYE